MNSTSSTQHNEIIGFEGPEKKIEMEFKLNSNMNFRQLNATDWQTRLLDFANCKIIAQRSNEYFDSYVLSESSLFVYPDKILLKTCGTTTLLNTVEPLLGIATELDMKLEFILYSRKNFIYPHVQPTPHTCFNEELSLLSGYFPHGSGFIIGPLCEDHWYVFIADYRTELVDEHNNLMVKPDQTFEVMMHDLDPDVMKLFYSSDEYISSQHTTDKSGISQLLSGSEICSHMFEPCGYSMNGLIGESYWTIHITPEAHCSYVSFETNYLPEKGTIGYRSLLKQIIDVFRPSRFTVTLIADDNVPLMDTSELDNDHSSAFLNIYSAFENLCLPQFAMKSKSHYEFDRGYTVTCCSFKKRNHPVKYSVA